MKKRDDTVYLRDILDAVRQIEIYVDGISFVDFQNDRMRQDAIVRQLESLEKQAVISLPQWLNEQLNQS